jgi:hypothetical protein
MTETMTMCACGKPLHYSSAHLREMIEQMVATLGECIVVKNLSSGKAFMVPRHYIALHGIRARELVVLAEKYGFKEATDEPVHPARS